MNYSIVTATFNRADYLPTIYENLKSNQLENFEWILIDDGSTDETELIANKWLALGELNFRYYRIPNGGKANAICFAFSQEVRGTYALVLDSDDYLTPGLLDSLNAELTTSNNCIGVVGLKARLNGTLIGTEFTKHYGTYLDLYYGKNPVKGDKLFIINTLIYKEHMRGPFAGEKMLPDSIVYISLNNEGKFKFMNKIFYFGDYLNDGWSSNINKLILNNINGMIFEKILLQKARLIIKHRLLINIKYVYYSLVGRRSIVDIVSFSEDKFLTVILLPLTFLYYLYKPIKS